jgi:transcription elongation factor Elf1
MASEGRTKLGFNVECPHCGHDRVILDLNDLDAIECPECGEEFTAEQAVLRATKKLAVWQRGQQWIVRARPIIDDEVTPY